MMQSEKKMEEMFGFSPQQVCHWRRSVFAARDQMFRKHWKNRRQIPDLCSLEDARGFEFLVEWYDEYNELVDRDKERRRLDRVISLGMDVNAPRETQPLV